MPEKINMFFFNLKNQSNRTPLFRASVPRVINRNVISPVVMNLPNNRSNINNFQLSSIYNHKGPSCGWGGAKR